MSDLSNFTSMLKSANIPYKLDDLETNGIRVTITVPNRDDYEDNPIIGGYNDFYTEFIFSDEENNLSNVNVWE